MNLNKVMLIGRLGKDPEVRYFDNEEAVANFSLATSENFTDKAGEKQERTEWHNIVCYRKLGELAGKFLKKGSLIYVEGKLRSRSYGDENNKKYITEVLANDFRMLEKRSDGQQGSFPPPPETANRNANPRPESQPAKSAAPPMANEMEDDDLPF